MSYNKLNLSEGTVLTDKHLAHIENGIENADASHVMKPFVEMGALTTSGDIGMIFYGKKYYRTAKFLKITNKTIKLLISETCENLVFEYDKNFEYITHVTLTQNKNTEQEHTVSENCKYIKLCLRIDGGNTEFDGVPELTIDGVSNNEYFNIRPSDDGYLRLAVPVQLTTVETDSDSYTVQDSFNLGHTYGILTLPKTYSNVGKPTRLIIYCHGAGARYTNTSTRLNSNDVDPKYWLAEGYAVMDVDGNPWSSTVPHLYIPEARMCYENAYKWVINSFNIYNDGVFLGGRSMGGSTCLDLLFSNIPILACCPLAASANSIELWSYNNQERNNFLFDRYGFTGDRPTLSGGGNLTDAEWDYLYENFDKWVTHAPEWRGIVDLPDKDVMFEATRGSSSDDERWEKEIELYKTLHFKTNVPLKFFNAMNDTSASYWRNAGLIYTAAKNGGCVVEQRFFNTSLTGSNAHRFELKDPKSYTTHTTIFGETISAPIPYIEMLQFWRRYERFI